MGFFFLYCMCTYFVLCGCKRIRPIGQFVPSDNSSQQRVCPKMICPKDDLSYWMIRPIGGFVPTENLSQRRICANLCFHMAQCNSKYSWFRKLQWTHTISEFQHWLPLPDLSLPYIRWPWAAAWFGGYFLIVYIWTYCCATKGCALYISIYL